MSRLIYSVVARMLESGNRRSLNDASMNFAGSSVCKMRLAGRGTDLQSDFFCSEFDRFADDPLSLERDKSISW